MTKLLRLFIPHLFSRLDEHFQTIQYVIPVKNRYVLPGTKLEYRIIKVSVFGLNLRVEFSDFADLYIHR
jgi:hypothetical protein